MNESKAPNEITAAEERDIAIEEWKLLASIIGRHEQIIFVMRGWMITMLTAIALVRLKENPLVGTKSFLVLAIGVEACFFLMELVQRAPIRRGIHYARQLEKDICNAKCNESPRLSESLKATSLWVDLFDGLKETGRIRVWVPYSALVVVVLCVARIAPDPSSNVPPVPAHSTSIHMDFSGSHTQIKIDTAESTTRIKIP